MLLSGLAKEIFTLMNRNELETKNSKPKEYWQAINKNRKDYLAQKARERRARQKGENSERIQSIQSPASIQSESSVYKEKSIQPTPQTESIQSQPTYCCAHLGYNMLGEEWHTGSCPKWPKKVDTAKFLKELGLK